MGRCLLHAQCSDLCFVVTDTTDATVNMERNPKDSVVCGGKVYAKGAPVEPPMQPAEVSHLVPFQWCAACLCIICSETQTAVSTRKSCLLMEAGCCPSTAGSLEGGSQCSALVGARMA